MNHAGSTCGEGVVAVALVLLLQLFTVLETLSKSPGLGVTFFYEEYRYHGTDLSDGDLSRLTNGSLLPDLRPWVHHGHYHPSRAVLSLLGLCHRHALWVPTHLTS